MPGFEALRFRGAHAADTMDAIDHFGALRLGHSQRGGHQQLGPRCNWSQSPPNERPASRSATCRYWRSTGDGERRYLDADTAGFRCTCLLQGLELHNKAFNGGGAVRQLAPGYVFQLIQLGRFAAGANRLTALAVDHTARNDLGRCEKGQVKLLLLS
jgi:type VI secretion system secreted protein VgrG